VEKAVSPNLTTLDLLISLVGYTAVYCSLAYAMFYLMRKFAVAGPGATLRESVDLAEGKETAPMYIGSQD
jgi:cytochrome bd-type quinol oxidase subunit 1